MSSDAELSELISIAAGLLRILPDAGEPIGYHEVHRKLCDSATRLRDCRDRLSRLTPEPSVTIIDNFNPADSAAGDDWKALAGEFVESEPSICPQCGEEKPTPHLLVDDPYCAECWNKLCETYAFRPALTPPEPSVEEVIELARVKHPECCDWDVTWRDGNSEWTINGWKKAESGPYDTMVAYQDVADTLSQLAANLKGEG